MGFGNAEGFRLTLGMGDLYFNKNYVGALKGSVKANYNPSFAFQRPGNNLVDLKAERTQEEFVLEAEVCDLKLIQLAKAMGLAATPAAITGTFRKRDVVALTTVAVTLSHTPVAGTMKVSKLDRSKLYISSTDYSNSTNLVTRKGGGAITGGQYVIFEYNVADAAAAVLKVGGEQTTPNVFELDFVHELSNGKVLQVTIYRALAMTNLSLAFNEKKSGTFTTHNISFKALMDPTKPDGANLFEIVEETGGATTTVTP